MNQNVSPEKRAKILHQVRTLLDIADRETTPPGEAESARAKAEQFMRDYRIEEESALAVDPASLKPEMRIVQLVPRGNDFARNQINLFNDIARHVGARSRFTYSGGFLIAQVVGYAFDLEVLELLYTSARLVFSEHLEPGKDERLSDQENIYRLRRSGMERWRVGQIMWGTGPKDGNAAGKVAKIYAAECERRGEPVAMAGRGSSISVYRASYADGFVIQLGSRLRRARAGADKVGGAVVLAGREDRVAEAFYTAFPEYRPSAEVALTTDDTPCPDCARTKHASGQCRMHRPRPITKAEERAYERTYRSASARAGAGAGRAAADAVAIDGSEPARRLDDGSGEERETTRAVQGILGN